MSNGSKIINNLLIVGLLLLVRSAQALQFFGGVTDPGLGLAHDNFYGYPYSWPDTLFLQLPYSQLTCQDSASQYQIIRGVNSFPGVLGEGFQPFYKCLDFARANHIKFVTFYAGYGGAIAGSWPTGYGIGVTVSNLVEMNANWLAQLHMIFANYPDITILFNYANEPLHSGPDSDWGRAYGGAGATGIDWLIALGKQYKSAFADQPNVMFGVNDFDDESPNNNLPYGEPSLLSRYLPWIRALANANVLDWFGVEGYHLNAVPSADITNAISQMVAAGAKNIVFTEFSPTGIVNGQPTPSQLNAWQRLLPLLAANCNVMGVTGPWWFRSSDPNQYHTSWIIDDSANPLSDSGTFTPSADWLAATVPSLVGNCGPTSTPSPSPAPSPSPTSTPTPQPSPTATPSPTPVGPTPTPASTPTPSPSPPLPTPTPSSSPTPTSTPSPQSTPPLQPTPTPVQTPTPTPTPTPDSTPGPHHHHHDHDDGDDHEDGNGQNQVWFWDWLQEEL